MDTLKSGSGWFVVLNGNTGSYQYWDQTYTGAGPLTLQLIRKNQWVFLSEVKFDGSASPVPEPTTLALLGVATPTYFSVAISSAYLLSYAFSTSLPG